MKTIYSAYYNSDGVEGRGPMVLDISFTTRAAAAEYIDAKPGVMGRKQKWSEEQHGDWMIKETLLLESVSEVGEVSAAQARQRALAKLTMKDREILGLL